MTGLMSTVWFTTITDETTSVFIIYAIQIPTFQQYWALLSLREQWVKGRCWQLNSMVAPFITLYHLIVYSVSYLEIGALAVAASVKTSAWDNSPVLAADSGSVILLWGKSKRHHADQKVKVSQIQQKTALEQICFPYIFTRNWT